MKRISKPERERIFYEEINPALSGFARRIVEASEMRDPVLEETAHAELMAYYEEWVGKGYWHPGLTETVADFVSITDRRRGLDFYRLALQQADLLEVASYTIRISMAQCLFESGQREQAEACLRDGRSEAEECGDADYVDRADEVARDAQSL